MKRILLGSRIPFCLSLGLLLFATSTAHSDQPGPQHPYTRVSTDRRFVLAMVHHAYSKRGPVVDEELAKRYPKNGLYKNDDSNEAVWTIDWFDQYVHLASDGIHLVRSASASWPGMEENEAVAFYARGKLVRSYKVKELVEDPRTLWRTASNLHWWGSDEFDDANLRYTIRTKEGRTIVFDVRTGDILSATPATNKPFNLWRWPWTWVIAASVLLLTAAMVSRYLHLRGRNRDRSATE